MNTNKSTVLNDKDSNYVTSSPDDSMGSALADQAETQGLTMGCDGGCQGGVNAN